MQKFRHHEYTWSKPFAKERRGTRNPNIYCKGLSQAEYTRQWRAMRRQRGSGA